MIHIFVYPMWTIVLKHLATKIGMLCSTKVGINFADLAKMAQQLPT